MATLSLIAEPKQLEQQKHEEEVSNQHDDQQQQQHTESLTMCRYPSKKCWNTRARKRNGEMHNLCELHRQKANKNQRRLEQKRKACKKAAASAKRTRKSRAGVKSRAEAARATKLPKKQTAMAATALAATAKTLRMQRSSPVKNAPAVVRQSAVVAPTGFFTDLMLSESHLFTKQQSEQLALQPQQNDLGWPAALQNHHALQNNQIEIAQMPRPTSIAFGTDELLDADTDVASLVACLDASPLSASSMSALLVPPTSVGGSSSPIDVCDGLDAIAAVSDFRWHPFVVASADSFQDASSDELLSRGHW